MGSLIENFNSSSIWDLWLQFIVLSFIVLFSLTLIGYLVQFWLRWASRGDVEVGHPINLLLRSYIISNKEGDAITEKGLWRSIDYGSSQNEGYFVNLAFKSSAYKYIEENPRIFKGVDVEVIDEVGYEWMKATLLFMITIVASAVVALIFASPAVVLPVVGFVGFILGSRLVFDLTRSAKKLKSALDEHISDKGAHTDEAKDIDTEIRVDLK